MGYFNYEIETLPLLKLRALQDERLRQLVRYVYTRVPYYQAKFDEHGIKPQDIKGIGDLYKLPFTTKAALRDHYPFGLFALPVQQAIRLHCSSGTTGKPIVVGYTPNDIGIFSEVVARSLAAAGCTAGMKLQNAYGYGLFTGGLGLHYGAEKLGLTVIPISGGGTEKQILLLEDFQSDAICCTPSYALTLAEEIQRRGIDKRKLNLRYAILGAEPWTESIRIQVEDKLGVDATNIYGLSEIIGPGVSQEDVDEKGTGSYIWEDHFFPEIVDKDTGAPLPEGKSGVLVFTTLTKEAMPVIRYWTNDITSIYYDKSAKRSFVKMGPIQGRSDDMLIIRGVNLFHTQVEAMLEGFDTFSANYQLVVTHKGAMDDVEVKIEISNELFTALRKEKGADGLTDNGFVRDDDRVRRAVHGLEKKLKDHIGLHMNVSVAAPGTIPKSEGGKLNRILDLRKSK
jgi:phenylacetate-CoA ligase